MTEPIKPLSLEDLEKSLAAVGDLLAAGIDKMHLDAHGIARRDATLAHLLRQNAELHLTQQALLKAFADLRTRAAEQREPAGEDRGRASRSVKCGLRLPMDFGYCGKPYQHGGACGEPWDLVDRGSPGADASQAGRDFTVERLQERLRESLCRSCSGGGDVAAGCGDCDGIGTAKAEARVWRRRFEALRDAQKPAAPAPRAEPVPKTEATPPAGEASDPAEGPERCEVTRNLCGSDTWATGHPCQCAACKQWLARAAAPEAAPAQPVEGGERERLGREAYYAAQHEGYIRTHSWEELGPSARDPWCAAAEHIYTLGRASRDAEVAGLQAERDAAIGETQTSEAFNSGNGSYRP